MMFSKRKHIFGLVCFAVFLHVGFTCPAFAAPKAIRFGYIAADQLHSPAVMVMKERKLLESVGFAVEWSEFLTGADAMRAMVSGALDFACCGIAPVMITHSQGMKLAILAGTNQEGSSLVVNDSIKTIKDLDGRKIGTPGPGTIQDALIVSLARDNNVQVELIALKVTDMHLLLKGKEIDGFIAWAPHPARAIDENLGHELITSRGMMRGHQCCVLVTSENAVQNDLETVTKMLEAYFDAYIWFLNNQDESIKLMEKNVGMTEAVINRALRTVNYSYIPYCNMGSMQSMARSLIEIGRITIEEADIDPFVKSLYHPEMLEMVSGTKQPIR